MHRTLWTVMILAIGSPFAPADEPKPGEPAAEKPAVEAIADTRPATIQQVVDETLDSVVLVTVEGRDGRRAGIGTGFVISADGLVATNLHVIGEARPVSLRFHNGRRLSVTEVFASDRQLDLAIVRVPANDLKPLELAVDQEIPQGSSVIALGNPMGLRHSVVSGVVSGNREIEGRRMIQLAMPIEPGNSGGPLLDLKKRVRGVVTMKSAVTANLGFAIEVAALKRLLESPNPIPMQRWMTIGSLNPRDWSTVFGARWQKRASHIAVTEPGDSFGGRSLCLWNHDPPDEAYGVGVFVKLDDESGAAGLAFDADGGQRHYGFYPSAGRLRLTRFEGPSVYSWKVLHDIRSEHYRPERWNHLKVDVSDGQLKCYVNDKLVITHPTGSTLNGKTGLVKFRETGARFKQFQMQKEIPPTQLSDDRRAQVNARLAQIEVGQRTSSADVAELATDAVASLSVLQERAIEMELHAARLRELAHDVHVRQVCQNLRELFGGGDETTDLVRAALLVSKLDNRDLSVASYVADFEQLARQVSASLPENADPQQCLSTMNRFLFQQNGFHGSRTNYYHAANSYFDRVLDDREGLPITLSVLYMELGRKLNLNIEGIGLPGHFVVRYIPDKGDHRIVDVFDGGKSLSLDEAKSLAVQISGQPFRDEFLEPYMPSEIVIRMLRNLLGIAQRDNDKLAMLRYVEAMVAIEPDDPSHRGVRAILRHETGRKGAAIEDLDWFLETMPEGIDLDKIRVMKATFERG